MGQSYDSHSQEHKIPKQKVLIACFLLSATYCIVIFALMLLSLLETILVTYIMEKACQEQLRLRDHLEDKQEEVETDDFNTGETRAAFTEAY